VIEIPRVRIASAEIPPASEAAKCMPVTDADSGKIPVTEVLRVRPANALIPPVSETSKYVVQRRAIAAGKRTFSVMERPRVQLARALSTHVSECVH
jgi:hypothetical protein